MVEFLHISVSYIHSGVTFIQAQPFPSVKSDIMSESKPKVLLFDIGGVCVSDSRHDVYRQLHFASQSSGLLDSRHVVIYPAYIITDSSRSFPLSKQSSTMS